MSLPMPCVLAEGLAVALNQKISKPSAGAGMRWWAVGRLPVPMRYFITISSLADIINQVTSQHRPGGRRQLGRWLAAVASILMSLDISCLNFIFKPNPNFNS